MLLPFWKYHGTGNDFIMVDNRTLRWTPGPGEVQRLCHRHFGIGSDGLILIELSHAADFRMVFFNPDGSTSFCGNGSRCAVAFAQALGIVSGPCTFEAIDGVHKAQFIPGGVEVSMQPVGEVKEVKEGLYLHTGSPHVVVQVHDLENPELMPCARNIRYSEAYAPGGTNVNFIQVKDGVVHMRTYERGVEDETLSCGTGVTAAALAYAYLYDKNGEVKLRTRGGDLQVRFVRKGGSAFNDIWLSGPAQPVYKGEVEV